VNFKKKSFLIAGILTLSLILSGCIPLVSSEFSMNVGLREAWTFDIVITPMQGYDEQLLNELNNQFTDNQELKDAGVTIEVATQGQTPEGYIPIKTSMKGTGYELLNQIFGEQSITVDDSSGKRLIYFDLSMGEGGMAQTTTFTLSGGKILEHNGTQINDHTVVWNNYAGRMQATMVEPSLLDYWLYAAIAVIAVMVILFFILLVIGLSKSSKAKMPKAQPIVRNKTCIQCGSIIPAHAVFCPNCGMQQK
jgi:hypothetical protein